MLRTKILIAYLLFICFALTSCQNAEEVFIGSRLLDLCDDAYTLCGVPTGCVLDEDHYSESDFPGTRRVVVYAEEPETTFRVRLFFSKMESPGTELIVQVYEPDCTVEKNFASAHLKDVDLFEEAGDDRVLMFEFDTFQEGEHLLEIYSDSSAEYLLIAEPK
ncbi:MAG: hypothetical protein GY854_04335 [Deltaproteobacteria bacterium]|nr:hypothetical protein [Deltaproteobacteria bacterium]